MSTKRKRGSSWEYIIRCKALLPRPLSLSFQDEAEGDTYVAQLERLLAAGILPPEFSERADAVKTLRQAMRKYATEQSIKDSDEALLIALEDRIGDVRLSEIDYAWAEKYVKEQKQVRHLAPGTIRHHIGALARMLDWYCRRGDLPSNPLRSLPKGYASYTPADAAVLKTVDKENRKDESRDRRLAPAEEVAIRSVLAGNKRDGRERPMTLHEREFLLLLFDLALETAMRLRELYTIDWSQVDLTNRTIFLDKTKNGSKRQVPLTTVAVARLSAQGNKKGLMFPWWKGDLSNATLRKITSMLSRQYSRIFEYAEIKDLTFHDLRHEATSRLFERTTLSELEIAKITGHSSSRMLMRYANLRGSGLANKLW